MNRSRGKFMNKDSDYIREIVDEFIQGMEGINEKRLQAARRELGYCTQEMNLFNEFRQNIYAIDNYGYGGLSGIPQDQ